MSHSFHLQTPSTVWVVGFFVCEGFLVVFFFLRVFFEVFFLLFLFFLYIDRLTGLNSHLSLPSTYLSVKLLKIIDVYRTHQEIFCFQKNNNLFGKKIMKIIIHNDSKIVTFRRPLCD